MLKIILAALILTSSLYITSEIVLKPEILTAIKKEVAVMDLELIETNDLGDTEYESKLMPAERTIILEARNTLMLRGPVTDRSVARLGVKALEMSQNLEDYEDIYLVLDTPGGSVFAGMELIDNLRALPQKIHTLTLFSASMGFLIVQNMDQRFITPSGTLMSHRASLGGLGGQLDGEFETRYKMIKRKTDYMDAIAAKRMKMSIEAYKDLIREEYWAHGFDAPEEQAADEMVNARCGDSFKGTIDVTESSFFGEIVITYSVCPLIRGPLKFDLSDIDENDEEEVEEMLNILTKNKRKYVKEFILTDKHFKFFPE